MNRSELKKLSKSQLKGHWKVPVVLTLIYGAIVLAISLSQNFSNSGGTVFLCFLLSLVVEVWAVVGFPNFYLKFIDDNDTTHFKDFFVSKGLLFKSLGYVIFMSLIGAVIGLIIGLTMISSVAYSVFGYTTYMWPTIIVIILALSAVVIVFSISIAMTAYILVDKEGTKVFEAIGLSMRMMKGHKWEFFVLYLSFIGWAILCLLTLGIGYLWLAPYISLTYTNYYKELDKNYTAINSNL